MTDQLSMFQTDAYGNLGVSPEFDGVTYEPERDKARLTGQLERVRALMSDGQWRTLRQIAEAVGGSEAGVSARLRDLKKKKFGGLTVDKVHAAGGVWVYRVVGQ